MKSQSQADKPRKTHYILSWILCLFFCLGISAGGFFTSLCMLGCATVAAPPLRAKLQLPKGLWIPLAAVLFSIGCMASPLAVEPADETSLITPQTLSAVIPEEDSVSLATNAGPDLSTATEDNDEAGSESEDEDDADIIVYITETGSKYHLGTCTTLKKSKIATTLEDAKAQGYEPCKLCHPPT